MINIVNLERTQDGGVVICHWQASKVEGEFEAKTYGTKSFTPDSSAEGFTVFEDLTQEKVISWFDVEDIAQIESILDADLAAQAEPQVISGTPW